MVTRNNSKLAGPSGRRMLLRAAAVGTGVLVAACTNDVVGAAEHADAGSDVRTCSDCGLSTADAGFGITLADGGTHDDGRVAVGLGPLDGGPAPVDAGSDVRGCSDCGLTAADAGGGLTLSDAGGDAQQHGFFPGDAGGQ